MTEDLQGTLQRTFDSLRSADLPDDYWERQPAMLAFLRWGDEGLLDIVRRWSDQAVASQTTDGRFFYGGTTRLRFGDFQTMSSPIMQNFLKTASVSAYFGYPILLLAERDQDTRYREAVRRQLEAVLAGPRTTEGFLLMNANAREVWIDELYPICGLLAAHGRITGDDRHVNEAYDHLQISIRRLFDHNTGLMRHVWLEKPDSFTESCFWSRGNGFFLLSAAQVLAECPDHSAAEQIREALGTVLGAYASRQDATGFIFDYIDDDDTALEASGTAMFAAACGMAHELGVVGEELVENGAAAVRAVMSIVDDEGRIGRTSLPPGGPGAAFSQMYLTQSFLLLAASYLGDALGVSAPEVTG